MKVEIISLVVLVPSAQSFVIPKAKHVPKITALYGSGNTRKEFLVTVGKCVVPTVVPSIIPTGVPAAHALVKGNAPPPAKKSSGEKKCRNVEECQEMAERQAALELEEAKASAVPAQVAPGGTRYLDLEGGLPVGSQVGSEVGAQAGDTVEILYKVLKLGKRSFDGLSGEGTVVFSRGFNLEDDETSAGDKSFRFQIGDPAVIAALNDGILGLLPGRTRRLSIAPQKGWEKNTPQCDGGPGGKGAGGDLKTDYVVVPTATMVDQEACFDKFKKPFPDSFAQQRRMAQRFDQALIMEVQLVNIL